MADVTELITRFGFEGSIDPLQDYNQALGSSIKLIAGMITAAVAGTAAMTAFTNSQLSALQPLINISDRGNIAIKTMQELGFIAEATGSDFGTMQGTLDSLSGTLSDAAFNGSDDFSRLGISIRDAHGEIKTADNVLLEVGQSFKRLGLNMQEQQTFASALGIDLSLLSMLNKTTSEIDKLRKESQEFGQLTENQKKQIIDYNASVNTLGAGFNQLKNIIAVALAPEMQIMAEGTKDLLKEFKDFIIQGVTKLSKFIGELSRLLKRMAPAIVAVGAAFLVAKVYALGFAGVLALITAPLVLIVAGITAAILILDDLYIALNGGESVIADFIKNITGIDIVPIMQKMVDFSKKVTSEIIKIFTEGAPIVSDLFKSFFEIDVTSIFKSIINDIKKMIEDIKSIATSASNFIFGSDDEETVPSKNKNSSYINDRYGIEKATNNYTYGTSQTGGNTINQNVVQNITTDNPKMAGDRSALKLNKQLRDATNQMTDVGGI